MTWGDLGAIEHEHFIMWALGAALCKATMPVAACTIHLLPIALAAHTYTRTPTHAQISDISSQCRDLWKQHEAAAKAAAGGGGAADKSDGWWFGWGKKG